MKNSKCYILIFLLILFSSLCFAQLTIEYPNIDYFKQNTDYNLQFNVYNDLGIKEETDCNFTLFKTNGSILYNELVQTNKIFLSKTNFTDLEKQYYSIYCNTTTDGSFLNKDMEITIDGREQKKSEYIFLLVLLSIFILLWVLKYISETLSKKHEILKGLLIVNMVLLSILGIFISFFMAIGDFDIQIEILQKNILVILTIFASCISAYFLVMWIISLNIKNKNKYGNNK